VALLRVALLFHSVAVPGWKARPIEDTITETGESLLALPR
jgi:hypothetical protein